MNRRINLTMRQIIYISLGILLIAGAVIIILIAANAEDERTQEETPSTLAMGTSTNEMAAVPSTTPTQAPLSSSTPEATPTLQPYEHLVKEGETLYFIIQLYGYRTLDVIPEILLLNGMADEDDLFLDTILYIPRQTPTPGPTPENSTAVAVDEGSATLAEQDDVQPATEVPSDSTADYSQCSLDNPCVSQDGNFWIHVVQEGETIAGLAFGYGTRVEDIQRANNLATDIIYPSQQLNIPILVTLTPTLTPTGGPDATATPTPFFSAPTLLAPVNNAEFDRGQLVILQWLSERPLGGDENYLVIVKNRATGEEFKAVTRSTLLRLPPELQPDLGEELYYEWTVLVIRGETVSGQVISSLGSARVFAWG